MEATAGPSGSGASGAARWAAAEGAPWTGWAAGSGSAAGRETWGGWFRASDEPGDVERPDAQK
eukprot:9006191-Alexandrium_andersonii.AAC.1